jgi:hypothetical protein
MDFIKQYYVEINVKNTYFLPEKSDGCQLLDGSGGQAVVTNKIKQSYITIKKSSSEKLTQH